MYSQCLNLLKIYNQSHAYIFPDINECISNPCKNSTSCINKVGGYTCTCMAGYTGAHCETGRSIGTHAPVKLNLKCDNGGYKCTHMYMYMYIS